MPMADIYQSPTARRLQEQRERAEQERLLEEHAQAAQLLATALAPTSTLDVRNNANRSSNSNNNSMSINSANTSSLTVYEVQASVPLPAAYLMEQVRRQRVQQLAEERGVTVEDILRAEDGDVTNPYGEPVAYMPNVLNSTSDDVDYDDDEVGSDKEVVWPPLCGAANSSKAPDAEEELHQKRHSAAQSIERALPARRRNVSTDQLDSSQPSSSPETSVQQQQPRHCRSGLHDQRTISPGSSRLDSHYDGASMTLDEHGRIVDVLEEDTAVGAASAAAAARCSSNTPTHRADGSDVDADKEKKQKRRQQRDAAQYKKGPSRGGDGDSNLLNPPRHTDPMPSGNVSAASATAADIAGSANNSTCNNSKNYSAAVDGGANGDSCQEPRQRGQSQPHLSATVPQQDGQGRNDGANSPASHLHQHRQSHQHRMPATGSSQSVDMLATAAVGDSNNNHNNDETNSEYSFGIPMATAPGQQARSTTLQTARTTPGTTPLALTTSVDGPEVQQPIRHSLSLSDLEAMAAAGPATGTVLTQTNLNTQQQQLLARRRQLQQDRLRQLESLRRYRGGSVIPGRAPPATGKHPRRCACGGYKTMGRGYLEPYCLQRKNDCNMQ